MANTRHDQALLDALTNSTTGYVTIEHGRHRSKTWGQHQKAAATSLRDRGVITIESLGSAQVSYTGRSSRRSTQWLVKLAGR